MPSGTHGRVRAFRVGRRFAGRDDRTMIGATFHGLCEYKLGQNRIENGRGMTDSGSGRAAVDVDGQGREHGDKPPPTARLQCGTSPRPPIIKSRAALVRKATRLTLTHACGQPGIRPGVAAENDGEHHQEAKLPHPLRCPHKQPDQRRHPAQCQGETSPRPRRQMGWS